MSALIVVLLAVLVMAVIALVMMGRLLYLIRHELDQIKKAPVTEDEAQAIDPDNPPWYSVYRPEHYDPDKAPRCACHREVIKYGDQILLWPIPHHPDGAVDIFCAKTYTQVKA
jgi:hypothetical protein